MRENKTTLWLLIGRLSVGGAERTLVDLANGLDKSKYEVTVWTIQDQGPLSNDLADSVEYRTLGAKGKFDLTVLPRFVKAMRTDRPDIVQSFLYFDNILARLAGLLVRNVTIITGVRAVPNDQQWHRERLDRYTMWMSDKIASNSEAGAEYAVKRGASSDKLEVIQNGRDITKYADGNATEEVYHSLGISECDPVVGTVGRLIERKGHYDLLAAWPSVLDSHPDAQLLFVGDGEEMKSLNNRAREIGCEESVTFVGQRDDVPDLLDAMDVFVFPSHYEGLPGALIEAMIAGLPIIATPVDGNSELIEHEVNGLLVPVKDSQKLSEQIVSLLSDQEKQTRLGTAAHEHAKEEFAIETMVSEFSALYDELIETGYTK